MTGGWRSAWVMALVLVAAPAAAQVVSKVPSGDTIVVAGVGAIRLVGVKSVDESRFGVGRDVAPPAAPPRTGPDAPPPPAVSAGIKLTPDRPTRDLLRELVLGRTVRLEYDTMTKGERRAYVFLPEGTLVNAELIRQGKAHVDRSHPFAHEEEFVSLEEEARSTGVGIWAGAPKK